MKKLRKIVPIMVEEMHIYWTHGQTFHPYIIEENGQEMDWIAIGVLKYIRTVINAYLKYQVKSYSKIDNSVNNQKSKVSKSNFS